MKQTYDSVNYEYLFSPTGDPFVDAGGYALKEFSSRYPDLDLLEIIMKATDIYVDNWDAKINPFFLNSKITQPAFKGDKKKKATKDYFLSLIDDSAIHTEGICRITGQITNLFPAGRDNCVLSGSGTFVNFHHFFEEGIMLSKEAIIRYHFLPLASESLQGRIAVIQSNRQDLSEYFGKTCCKRNLDAMASKISSGILKSRALSPGTAVFRYIDMFISEVKEITDNLNCSISLYLFTNFGAKPELEIYNLPFEAFRFYSFTQKAIFKREWNMFVSQYYRNKEYKNIKYDVQKNVVDYVDKDSSGVILEDDFKYWNNIIYDRLINEQPITSHLLTYSRKNKLNFEIIRIYEINIRNMKKETVGKLEQLADFIMKSNDEKGIKRAITKLDGVKNPYLLRRFILKDIVAKYYNEGNEKAIVTIEDYTNYLFPDTNSWQETRDVLLIAIYQKMHERNMHLEIKLPEDDAELENVKL